MKYCIRPMARQDIPQVTEIDREAFPTQAPPANYRHELDNRLAHYLVASTDDYNGSDPRPGSSGLSGLTQKLKRAFIPNGETPTPEPAPRQYLLGFAGFWIMADEAHITSIAVREKYRGYGIGELLLVSLIDLAASLHAGDVTLEVRLTNAGAQALYRKYGFAKVGVRPGYYTDNAEDAIIMTLDDLPSPEVRENLARLKEAHARKWGTRIESDRTCVTLPPGLR